MTENLKPQSRGGSVRVTVVLPKAAYIAISTLAHDQGRNMSNLIRFVLEKFLEKNT